MTADLWVSFSESERQEALAGAMENCKQLVDCHVRLKGMLEVLKRAQRSLGALVREWPGDLFEPWPVSGQAPAVGDLFELWPVSGQAPADGEWVLSQVQGALNHVCAELRQAEEEARPRVPESADRFLAAENLLRSFVPLMRAGFIQSGGRPIPEHLEEQLGLLGPAVKELMGALFEERDAPLAARIMGRRPHLLKKEDKTALVFGEFSLDLTRAKKQASVAEALCIEGVIHEEANLYAAAARVAPESWREGRPGQSVRHAASTYNALAKKLERSPCPLTREYATYGFQMDLTS